MQDGPIKTIGSITLTTKRLELRPFELDDAMAVFGWACDPEVTLYLRFPVHESISDSKRIISAWIDAAKRPPYFHWALTLRETGQVIGSMGIEVSNVHDRRGEVGYCLSKCFWNQGYATEALKTVLHFGFTIANFHRIEGCHSTKNPASGKVMSKAGMRFEAGPLHDYYRSDILGYQDAIMLVAFSDSYQED
ncbi:MAG: N-acetyltransferase [Spirochaetae bacterium HGW-Spirochaetae-8]|nr:MAG: N-acetyltransferase [Spirochaetae bacterium HGW-Spirochaetae-8]